jgi:hypothetical protein
MHQERKEMGMHRLFLLAAIVLFAIAGLGAIGTFSGINVLGLTCFGLACAGVAAMKPLKARH